MVRYIDETWLDLYKGRWNDLPHTSVDLNPLVRESLARRLSRRSVLTGEIKLPAVPSMIDEYMTTCDTIFAGAGRRFSIEEPADLRVAIEAQLAEAYSASPRSTIAISFDAAQSAGLNYNVKSQWSTVQATMRIGPTPASRHCLTANRMLACAEEPAESRDPDGRLSGNSWREETQKPPFRDEIGGFCVCSRVSSSQCCR